MKRHLKTIFSFLLLAAPLFPAAADPGQADSLPVTVRITVESYNILSTRANFKSHWDNRREAFGRTVLRESNFPDVIGFQECQEEPQMQDIIGMLGGAYDYYLSPEQAMSARLIMWKKGMFEPVETGYIDLIPGKRAGVQREKGGRYSAFVRLRHLETGREFYFYNIHIRTGSKPEVVALRKEQIDYLAGYAKEVSMNAGELPVIILGDMNSYPTTVIEGIPGSRMSFARHGFRDTFEMAGNRVNEDYSTYNTQGNVDSCTVTYAPGGSRRIDYTVVWPADRFTVRDYEIVINFTDRQNRKAECPLPSDHNPVRSVLEIKYWK